mmetsp:Transcript_25479/g.71257  ORF Transcript_25479/g.71257 Transcript_25479/m.71257 type:complete len:268 (-) Transcript_25479:94-897(-)
MCSLRLSTKRIIFSEDSCVTAKLCRNSSSVGLRLLHSRGQWMEVTTSCPKSTVTSSHRPRAAGLSSICFQRWHTWARKGYARSPRCHSMSHSSFRNGNRRWNQRGSSSSRPPTLARCRNTLSSSSLGRLSMFGLRGVDSPSCWGSAAFLARVFLGMLAALQAKGREIAQPSNAKGGSIGLPAPALCVAENRARLRHLAVAFQVCGASVANGQGARQREALFSLSCADRMGVRQLPEECEGRRYGSPQRMFREGFSGRRRQSFPVWRT